MKYSNVGERGNDGLPGYVGIPGNVLLNSTTAGIFLKNF